MFNKIKKIIVSFFWIPIVLGVIGYWLMEGVPFFYALYYSLLMYTGESATDVTNGLILFARYLAIWVSVGFVATLTKAALENLNSWTVGMRKDAVVIYTDNKWGELFKRNLNENHKKISKCYIKPLEDDEVGKAQKHVIMHNDELRNIDFLSDHKEELKGKDVYIMLSDINSFLLSENKDPHVHFFNLYELMARYYWKNYSLFDEAIKGSFLKIGIIGYGKMGREIFQYAYLNNLFSAKQKIEYHIWGYDKSEEKELNNLNMMNEDIVCVHNGDWKEDFEILGGMKRIILCVDDGLDALQRVLLKLPNVPVHCYIDNDTKIKELFVSDMVESFGDMSILLNEDTIFKETMLTSAKLINYDYVLGKRNYNKKKLPENYETEVDEEWNKLDGFTKGSNIARADHYEIEQRKIECGKDEDIPELEHIRWCRFHFWNGWQFEEDVDDGTDPDIRKNNRKKRKRHHLLRPYDESKDKRNNEIYSEEINKKIKETLANNNAEC